MSSKLLKEFSDDPKLEKHIGCMTGFFRIFDRQPALRSRNPCPQKQLHGRRIAVDKSSRWDPNLLGTDCLDSESPRRSFESFLQPKTSVRSTGLKVSPFDGSESSQCFNSKDPPRPSFDSKEAAQIFSYYRDGSKGGSITPQGNAKCFLEAVEAKKSKSTNMNQASTLLEARLAIRCSLDSDVRSTSNYANKTGNSMDGRKEKQGHRQMFANIKKAGNTSKPMELPRTSVDCREALKTLSKEDDLFLQDLKACETAKEAFPSRQPPRKSGDMKECLRVLSKLREAGWDDFVKETSKNLFELKEPPRHSCDGWEAPKPSTDRIPRQLKEPPRHSVDGSFPLHEFRDSWLPNPRHRSPDDLPMRSFNIEVGSSSLLAQKVPSVKSCNITASEKISQIETKRRKPNVIARLMGLEDMPIVCAKSTNHVVKKPSREAKVLQNLLLYQPSKDPIQTKMIDQRRSNTVKKPIFEAGKNKKLAIVQVESSQTVRKAVNRLEGSRWQDGLHDNDHQMIENAPSIDRETVTNTRVSKNSVQKENSLLLTTADNTVRLNESEPKSVSRINITYDQTLEACSKNEGLRRWSETKKASLGKESGMDLKTSTNVFLETMWQQRGDNYYTKKPFEHSKQKDHSSYGLNIYSGAADTELMKNDSYVSRKGHVYEVEFAPHQSKWTIPGKRQEYMLRGSEKSSNARRLSKAQHLAHDQRPANQLKGEALPLKKTQGIIAASISNRLQLVDSIDMESELKPIKASSSTQSPAKSCSTVMTVLGSTGGCSKSEDKTLQKMKKINPSGNLRRDKWESIATMAMQSHISRATQRTSEGGKKYFQKSRWRSSPNSDTMGHPEPVIQVRIHQPLQGTVDQLIESRIPFHYAQSKPPISIESIEDSDSKPLEEMINTRQSFKSDNVSDGMRNVCKLDKSTDTIAAVFGACVQEPSQIPQAQETGKRNAQLNQIMPICEGLLQNAVRTCDGEAEDHCLGNHDLPAISIESKAIEINKFFELHAMSKYGRTSSYEPLLIKSENQERLPIGKIQESSEQPSPVSVLDSLFHDECSPRSIVRTINLPDNVSSKSLETSYQTQTVETSVLRADLNTSESLTSVIRDTLRDDSSTNVSYQVERYGITCTDKRRCICQDNSKESLKVMLLTSGFVEVDTVLFWWQHLDLPTMANVPESLDNGGRLSSNGSTKTLDLYTQNFSNDTTPSSKESMEINRQLHAACLLEVLVRNLLSYVNTYSYLLKPPRGSEILEEAWAEVCNTRCLYREDDSGSIFGVLEKDLTAAMDHWHQFHVEIAEMGSTVERMILEDILQELICDWASTA